MVSKVDECSSATEVCKSVDILQAIRWSAMAWNKVSQSTIVKCFIKAGILNAEGETNAEEVAAGGDEDPFVEHDSDISAVEELAKETSGTDALSIKETVAGSFDPPFCYELPDNWEEVFFRKCSQLHPQEGINDNEADDDEVEDITPPVLPRITSYREAISCLEDALAFLERKGNNDTADALSSVICQAQSDWLERRTSQSKVTDFFTKS